MKDKIIRSITKSITWRVVALASTLVITTIFLGNFNQSVPMTITLNLSAMILYYFHERIWNISNWGKK